MQLKILLSDTDLSRAQAGGTFLASPSAPALAVALGWQNVFGLAALPLGCVDGIPAMHF